MEREMKNHIDDGKMTVKEAVEKWLGAEVLDGVDYIYDDQEPGEKRHINTILNNEVGEMDFRLKHGETDSPAFKCECLPGLSEPFLVYQDGKFFMWWNP